MSFRIIPTSVSHFIKSLPQALELSIDAESRSYYPDRKKSRVKILLENINWLVKHREINNFYYLYGFDIKDQFEQEQYIPYRQFMQLRNSRNLHPIPNEKYNYICLLRDKFVFGQLLASLGIPTPRNIALCNSSSVTWLDTNTQTPLEAIMLRELDAFCKLLTGECASGVFPFSVRNRKMLINHDEADLAILRKNIGNGHYILQNRINQHQALSELYPHAVNTIRLVTVNNHGKLATLSALLRIGANHKRVDNWASGGIAVGMNREDGTLVADGFFKPGFGGRVMTHPNTNVPFKGYQIPYFKEAVEMAYKLHSCMYGIHSIGWDIAISPEGPVFIEGNDNWEVSLMQMHENGLKKRFKELCKNHSDVPDVLATLTTH